jgi:hypothetical protein
LELNGTHQLLVYADDVNTLDANINIKKKNKAVLPEAYKEFGLEVNAEITKYMFIFRHQKAVQNYNFMTANKHFQNAAKFKYFGTTVKTKIAVTKNLRGILDTIQFMNFCLSIYSLKAYLIKYTKLEFRLFYVGMKLDLSQQRKNTD